MAVICFLELKPGNYPGKHFKLIIGPNLLICSKNLIYFFHALSFITGVWSKFLELDQHFIKTILNYAENPLLGLALVVVSELLAVLNLLEQPEH